MKRHKQGLWKTSKPLSALLGLASLLALAPALLAAEAPSRYDDALVTDRPDAAESSRTVGKLRVQVETGIDVEVSSLGAGGAGSGAGDRRSLRVPTKLRLGLIDALEIHVESGAFAYDSVEVGGGSTSETGLPDLDLGAKWHITEGGGWIPSLGLLVAASMPIGGEAFTEDIYALSPTLIADWELGAGVGLGTNLGITSPLTDRGSHDDSLRFAVAFGRSWDPLSERLGSYIEVFGETRGGGKEDPEMYIDGGFTFLVTPDLQLDVNARVGVTEPAADVGGGLGLSARF